MIENDGGFFPPLGSLRTWSASKLVLRVRIGHTHVMQFDDLAADFIAAGQALVNYRSSFAQAVEVFAVGTAFACDAEGPLCVYRRTAHEPFYELIHEVPSRSSVDGKVSAEDLAGPNGAGTVGLPQGGNVADAVQFVTPQMFGAEGDGATDDTAALRLAHATGKFVWYPRGTYRIFTNGTPIQVTASLDGDGATIKHDPGNGNGMSRMFLVENNRGHEKVVFGPGLVLDGQYDGAGTSGEQDHQISLRGAANIEVYATCINAYGDNVYVGNYNDEVVSHSITIDATLKNARRCNVALVCVDGAILRGRYSKIADYVASVDMEPNTGANFDYVTNVKIELEELSAPIGIIATANNGTPNRNLVIDIGKARCKYLFDFGPSALLQNVTIRRIGEFREWDPSRGVFGTFRGVEGLQFWNVNDGSECTDPAYNSWTLDECRAVVFGSGVKHCKHICGGMVLHHCDDVLYGEAFTIKDAYLSSSPRFAGAIIINGVDNFRYRGKIVGAGCNAVYVTSGGLFNGAFEAGVIESATAGIRNDSASSTYSIGSEVSFRGSLTFGYHDTTKSALGVSSHQVRTGTVIYDPPCLSPGASVHTTVSVSDAAIGDHAAASFSQDLTGVVLTASVSSTNTVSVTFTNNTAADVNLASGTLRLRVDKVR